MPSVSFGGSGSLIERLPDWDVCVAAQSSGSSREEGGSGRFGEIHEVVSNEVGDAREARSYICESLLVAVGGGGLRRELSLVWKARLLDLLLTPEGINLLMLNHGMCALCNQFRHYVILRDVLIKDGLGAKVAVDG